MPPTEEQLVQTIVRYFAGELTPDEGRELNATLDHSPEARRLFNELSLQLVALHDWAPLPPEVATAEVTTAEVTPATPQPLPPPAFSSGRWGWVALAASLLCAAILWNWNGPAPGRLGPFATVVSLQSARWHSAALAAGDRIGAQRLTLGEGLAQVTLDNGVELLLQAPIDLEFTSAMLLRVRAGSLTARVSPGAIGFTVETDSATIVDQGTEFGVQVGDRGATLVQVFEGSVEAHDRTGAISQQVAAGKAVEFDAAYPVARPQKFQSERFTRQFPDPATLAPAVRSVPYNLQTIRQVDVLPAPGKIEIDGQLADWTFRPFEVRSIEPYQQTYSLRGGMMYDAQYLYLAAQVDDPFPLVNPQPPEAEHPWRGGAVQVRLVADRRYPWPYSAEQPEYRMQTQKQVQADDRADRFVHLILWYSNPAKRPCLHLAYGMDLHGVQVNPAGFQGAFVKNADGLGYTLEYAILWSLLQAGAAPPQPGDVLGATWQVQFANQQGEWRGHLMDLFHETERGWPFHRAATWGQAKYR